MPQDRVLCEPSEVSEIMRNLPPFEKSPAENDELGAVSKAPIRQLVEPCAKDTPMGQCAPRWAEVARRVLVPSDEWQLTRSMLDGCGRGSHDRCLSTAGMGKKCRDGFSDGGFSHVTHGRVEQRALWVLSASRFWRFVYVRTPERQQVPLGATDEDGVCAACTTGRRKSAVPAASRLSSGGPAMQQSLMGSRSKRMETNQELRVVRT